jgi:pimeloyl-ACP methyl ester carboxylesterase
MVDNPTDAANDGGRDMFVSAQDGLRLHVREYGRRSAPGLPAVCLPGLTRTVADFDTLAPALVAAGPTRRVIAIDSRGRGRSEYDRNPANYSIPIELADVMTVLIALAVGPAIFIGSSRGGLITLHLGVVQPTAIAGVVLHDIGPVLEPKGLARIKSYVGKLPQPRSFDEGAEILRRLSGAQFPNFTSEQWLAAAHRGWRAGAKGGALIPTHDVRIMETLAGLDVERQQPPQWTEFDALSRVPMLVIHGANSDLLSAATVEAMQARRAQKHAETEIVEVAEEGHVPALEGVLVDRIVAFAALCDQASGVAAAGGGVSTAPA